MQVLTAAAKALMASDIYRLPQDYPILFLTLAGLGLFWCTGWLFSILRLAYENHVLSGINLKKFNATGDDYALITGSTDGIGKEFALQLAKLGYNLILVSRTAAKLKAVAQEINERYPEVGVKTLAVDCTQITEDDYTKLQQLVDKNTVSILVRLTKICLGPMVKRQRGLVINVGSFAGMMPTPLLQTYSGTKAFLRNWSESLNVELRPVGVRVAHLNTYFVVSNMSKISRPSLMIPSARDYVRSALKKIGCKSSITGTITPYPWHNIMRWAIDNLISRDYLLKRTYEMQVSIRKRALRKMERQAKAE